jgi:hypothetical protein
MARDLTIIFAGAAVIALEKRMLPPERKSSLAVPVENSPRIFNSPLQPGCPFWFFPPSAICEHLTP